MNVNLTEKEWQITVHALEVAANRFKEDAEQTDFEGSPDNWVASQFYKQERETRAVIDHINAVIEV